MRKFCKCGHSDLMHARMKDGEEVDGPCTMYGCKCERFSADEIGALK